MKSSAAHSIKNGKLIQGKKFNALPVNVSSSSSKPNP
jgi:hypothetical protein